MLHARGSPMAKKGVGAGIYTHYNSLTIMHNTPAETETGTKTATSITAICLTQFVLISFWRITKPKSRAHTSLAHCFCTNVWRKIYTLFSRVIHRSYARHLSEPLGGNRSWLRKFWRISLKYSGYNLYKGETSGGYHKMS